MHGHDQSTGQGQAAAAVLTVAHIVYALPSCALVLSLAGTATVVGSCVGRLPSLATVLLHYLKRGEAHGTRVASHDHWQLRLCWCAVLGVLLGWELAARLAVRWWACRS
jgi:uncharacterized membrane protein